MIKSSLNFSFVITVAALDAIGCADHQTSHRINMFDIVPVEDIEDSKFFYALSHVLMFVCITHQRLHTCSLPAQKWLSVVLCERLGRPR